MIDRGALYRALFPDRIVQYVDNLVEGVLRLLGSAETRPVNVGKPDEHSAREIAEVVVEAHRQPSELAFGRLPGGASKQRCTHITRARDVSGWVFRKFGR